MSGGTLSWLVLAELGLAVVAVTWAVFSETPIPYELDRGAFLLASGLTLVFATLNFALFFAGRRAGLARGVYRFFEEEIFPLVRRSKPPELLAAAALAGFAEELLFRGLLQPRIGLLAASFVFGFLHGPSPALWPHAVWAGGVGLALGIVYQATENLAVPVLVHAFYDALALLYVRFRWEQPRVDSISGGP